MGKHWRATLTAEDGSVLKVIGERPERGKGKGAADVARKVRNAATARAERDEARTWEREARNLRGQWVAGLD